MNKEYDDELKALFQQHKQEIPDNGFSKRVRQNLPAGSTPLWHYGVIAMFLLIALIIISAFNLFPSADLIVGEMQLNIEIFTQTLVSVLLNKYFYLAMLAALSVVVVYSIRKSKLAF